MQACRTFHAVAAVAALGLPADLLTVPLPSLQGVCGNTDRFCGQYCLSGACLGRASPPPPALKPKPKPSPPPPTKQPTSQPPTAGQQSSPPPPSPPPPSPPAETTPIVDPTQFVGERGLPVRCQQPKYTSKVSLAAPGAPACAVHSRAQPGWDALCAQTGSLPPACTRLSHAAATLHHGPAAPAGRLSAGSTAHRCLPVPSSPCRCRGERARE